MAWVFDTDGCLVDLLSGTSLRPLARQVLTGLRAQGIEIVLWSAGGADHARRRADEVGIAELVDHYYRKAGRDDDGRRRVDHLAPEHRTALFVDDSAEDLPAGVETLLVRPYLADNPHDRGLASALERLTRRPGPARGWPLCLVRTREAAMLIVAGRLEVDGNDRDRYVDECRSVVEQARRAPGCLDFAITADPLDASRINVYERWESDEELMAFRGSGPTEEMGAQIRSADVSKYRISATEDP